MCVNGAMQIRSALFGSVIVGGLLFGTPPAGRAAGDWIVLAKEGRPRIAIVKQHELIAPEQNAIQELRETLARIIGTEVPIREPDRLRDEEIPIYVGGGTEAKKAFLRSLGTNSNLNRS